MSEREINYIKAEIKFILCFKKTETKTEIVRGDLKEHTAVFPCFSLITTNHVHFTFLLNIIKTMETWYLL